MAVGVPYAKDAERRGMFIIPDERCDKTGWIINNRLCTCASGFRDTFKSLRSVFGFLGLVFGRPKLEVHSA